MIKTTVYFSLFFISLINFSFAQTDSLYHVKGTIKDDVSNEPIIGATISYASGKGTQTDLDGNYVLKLKNGVYTFTVSYIGYKAQVKKVKVDNNHIAALNFILAADVVLNEVEIVADVAKIRETPVAISNISAKQIQEELGARDIPMLLNSTPGVYATQQGGGAGDARVNIRGFSQNNVGVLVDGVPVNDMENGQVYWSNWAGLSEVTKTMQVQRGLGASRLALPSAGGTMNIITSSIDEKRFFVVKKDWASNAYERFAIGYNSGIIKNKFGVTLAGSYTKGDGWVNQTPQTAWSYFAKFTYRINSKNLIVFGANGAPQSHAQKATQIGMAYFDKDYAQKQGINVDSIYNVSNQSGNPYTTANIGQRGLQFNPDWGYVNGKVVNTKVNYFHKPLFNLSYFLTINDKLTYSNVLYASFGRGGGTSLSNNPGTDQTGTGQLKLQGVYDQNSVYINPSLDPTLHAVKSTYIYSSINNHNWIGTLSTFKWQINKAFHFTGGFDARYYNGIHYQTPYNLLGADYVQQSVNRDKNLAPISKDPTSYIRKVGDVINIYYASKVTWLGLFTQLEYKKNKWSTFLTLTGNQSSMQNINYYGKKDIVINKNNIIHNAVGYGDTLYTDGTNYGASMNGLPITRNTDGSVSFFNSFDNKQITIGPNYKTYSNSSAEARTNTSEVKYYYGYTMKGGANYKLTDNHNVFFNTGYMNLAPRYSNVFDRSGTELKNVKNQFITALELGYGLKYPKLAVNVNGYLTQWKNKPLDFASTFTDVDGNIFYYNVPGVDANLKGIELDFSYNATKWLSVNGFGMLADWRWVSTGTAYVFSDAGNLVNTIDFDAKNLHIANSPQQQIGGSFRLEPFQGFYIKPQYTFFNKMYSQFDPQNTALMSKELTLQITEFTKKTLGKCQVMA